MSRALRVEFPGARYHVMARGVARMPVFSDDEDYRQLLHETELQVQRGLLIVHAFCFMLNHIHFLCETPYAGLSRIMHDILGNYASGYNRRHDRVGHLWQGRYKAILVQDGDYQLGCSRYIHLNPYKAGVDSMDFSYPWSSCQNYIGKPSLAPWVRTDRILSHFGNPNEYRSFLEEPKDYVENPFEVAVAGIAYGDSAFVRQICRQARRKTAPEDQCSIRLIKKVDQMPTIETVRSAVSSVFFDASDCQIRRYLVWSLRTHTRLTGSEICCAVGLKRSAISEIFKSIEKRRFGDEAVACRLTEIRDQLRCSLAEISSSVQLIESDVPWPAKGVPPDSSD